MIDQNRLLLREYLSEEAALLLKNTMVFRHCLGAAWENDAGEEVEQLISALTRAATTAQHATLKLCDSSLSAEFNALHEKVNAARFYERPTATR